MHLGMSHFITFGTNNYSCIAKYIFWCCADDVDVDVDVNANFSFGYVQANKISLAFAHRCSSSFQFIQSAANPYFLDRFNSFNASNFEQKMFVFDDDL